MTVQLDSQQKSVFEKVLNTTLKECLEPLIRRAEAANRHIRTLRKEGKTNAAVFIEREAQAEVLLGAEHAWIGLLAGLEISYGLDLGGAKAKSERIFEKIFDNTKKICAGSDRETTDWESRDAMGKSTPERDAFMQAAARAWEQISALPEDQQPAAIEKAMSGFNALAQCQALPKPEKGEQTPDLSAIPQWVSREESGPASAYLKTHFKDYLKSENPALERDLICLQDLQAQHKPLWQGLYNESKVTGIKPSAYLASKPQRTKEAAQGADLEQIREAERTRKAVKRYGIASEPASLSYT